MPLEFNRLVEQVRSMGHFLSLRDKSMSERLEQALALFYAADDLNAVHERITEMHDLGVNSYRGAMGSSESVAQTFPRPPMPTSGTLIAADGSQVYPDAHAPTFYYLVNIGLFTCTYGERRAPSQSTEPTLYFDDKDVLDPDRRPITNTTVNARRTVAEIQGLAKQAWAMRGEAHPLVALHDGVLLKFFNAIEVTDAKKIEDDYLKALIALHDVQAILAGYLDKPRSTTIISLLHLLSLKPHQISETILKTNGELEGLTDAYLLGRVLQPGERSAILVQHSPQNKTYAERDPGYEIAFFYLNVSDDSRPHIARVDIPMWVARSSRAVDELQALVLAQCAIQGRRHYPYALTRADELAYITMAEKQQLNEMIGVELLNQQVEREASDKLQTKGLARGSRRQHRIGSR